MPYCYNYPRPAVSSDCVIFGFDGFQLNVLLIERKNDPYKGYWAFPGGFLEMD
ncbi:MAG TPA: NUDIX domain-containing protein, partial [Bacteroidales bacterium]|nr:NUDIX domain-containing protein [Bacteroidales bacterium]